MNRREFSLSLLAAVPALAVSARAQQSSAKLRINGARLNANLADLAQFGKTPEGGTSRVAYSESDLQARQYASKLMREAKLDVSIDAAGNIVGRRGGNDATLKPLMIGSHIDSVPAGGSYDGQVGSMAAIEVAQTLYVSRENQYRCGRRHCRSSLVGCNGRRICQSRRHDTDERAARCASGSG